MHLRAGRIQISTSPGLVYSAGGSLATQMCRYAPGSGSDELADMISITGIWGQKLFCLPFSLTVFQGEI